MRLKWGNVSDRADLERKPRTNNERSLCTYYTMNESLLT